MSLNGVDTKFLDDNIKKVPDFPHKGILFYDVTSIFTNPKSFKYCIDVLADLYKSKKIDCIAGLESRGFLLSAPLAYKLDLPNVLIRKAGKLPRETVKASYTLEYGSATIEVHKEDFAGYKNVLLMDDLIATGGTLEAAIKLANECGSKVQHVAGVIGLPFLNYQEKLNGVEVTTLIDYHSE